MFVRKKPNKSGSVSVQIIDKSSGKYRVVETLGSSKDPETIEALCQEAYRRIPHHSRQSTFSFLSATDEAILDFAKHLHNDNLSAVGGELVFGTLFDAMGFGAIKDRMFRHLVISRIIYQGSKLKLTHYLRRYEHKEISVYAIYRFLDKLHDRYKETIERIAFEHTRKILGTIHVVFYDMTTLYFEAEDEDDFRKIGFSKDGKFQNPQILLGLLVGEKGYPIGYELFEGNTFEGHTLIPVLEAFEKKFDLKRPIVVADSGLLSRSNLEALEEKGYGYILGARIKKETEAQSQQILAWNLERDGEYRELVREDGSRLIVSYSAKRAKKDAYNRKRGLQRLEKKIKSGTLSKKHINARGYNKYLKLKNEVEVAIDYERFEADGAWDGLKGYITNTDLSPETVIENYANLWQIEKAFRMSKSDLKIRPVYHRVRRRIEAHIAISFVAYAVYKELERLLYKHHAPFGVATAREIVQTIYQLRIKLPDSGVEEKILLNMNEEQRLLLEIVKQET
jgi:transposase